MVSAAGLGATFGGFQGAQALGDQHDINQFELNKSKSAFKALDAAGNALLELSMPGAQQIGGGPPPPPMGGPPQAPGQLGGPPPQPPMQPGQPSVPLQQPVGQGAPPGSPAASMGERWPAVPMPQAGGMTQQPRSQGPPGQPPQQGGGNMPQQGQMDLRSFIGAVKAKNPNITGTEMAQAVMQMLPVFNQESKQLLQALNLQLRSQGLDVREDIAKMQDETRRRGQDVTARGQDVRADTQMNIAQLQAAAKKYGIDTNKDVKTLQMEVQERIAKEKQEGQDRRLDKTEEGKERRSERTDTTTRRGQDTRADTAKVGQQQRAEQFKAREARLTRQAGEKNETALARIASQDAHWKTLQENREKAQSLSQKRAAIDAIHKHALDIVQTYSVMNKLTTKERVELRKQIDDAYNQEIKGLAGGGSQEGWSVKPK